ncbi:hypothetical protein SLEP1_g36902 [Rubroshorea leprosula]|uniref:Uncharacterized protein n=1 Tax=Rubroshorea leprosula TaxID=152421 RepID=A0AAV5KT60_9ROSI|nr:hypothetical protein SLEP1_g36902 [Rubroshorea leprosula]
MLRAAKEATALQEDKIKLEKEVEELTFHLQLEKQMRLQFQETRALLIKQHEVAKNVAEHVAVNESEAAKKVAERAVCHSGVSLGFITSSWEVDWRRLRRICGLRNNKTRNLRKDCVEWCAKSSNGRDGGLLCLWDPNIFERTEVFEGNGLLGVEGLWGKNKPKCCFLNVYGPCNVAGRAKL